METYHWYAGSGRPLELELTYDQIVSVPTQGECSEDVDALLPEIEDQTEKWHEDTLRMELKEYGCWDEDELANDEDNVRRMVWIAVGDLREEYREVFNARR